MTILSGRKIKKVYGKKLSAQEVLKGINMDVQEGEFVGIMGPSG
jgi:bacitracin transport system ATP-binding protein